MSFPSCSFRVPTLVPHQKHHHHGVAKILMIYTNCLLFRSAFCAPSILWNSMQHQHCEGRKPQKKAQIYVLVYLHSS